MTCIAGAVSDGRVWIGGDSASSNEYTISERVQPKVFRSAGFLLATCGSVRMSNLLRYSLTVAKRPTDMDLHEYMVTWFVDAVRRTLREGGLSRVTNNVEQVPRSGVLVGYQGHLYEFHGDYQITEPACGYAAMGSGGEVALGALYAVKQADPVWRANPAIRLALQAATELTPFVRAPFTILCDQEEPAKEAVA